VIIKNKYLLNFSVSTTSGGLKRLIEFSKWFNSNGGAWFIIHPACIFLKKKYPNNRYYIVKQNRLTRFFFDCFYLSKILHQVGKPEFYYSYGIPIYNRVAKINWFHLSNVLPILNNTTGLKLSLFDKLVRLKVLGNKIKKNFKNADIVSAESRNSLKLINKQQIKEAFLCINGSDDEIKFSQKVNKNQKDNIAIIVGTQKYKRISDGYLIFKYLRRKNKNLKLKIVGDIKNVSKKISNDERVILTGTLNHTKVIKLLKKAKYYISTTVIENSFNNASEGIFFAEESYISNIAPHKELLKDETHKTISLNFLNYKLLKIKRTNIKGKNLFLWDALIKKIIHKIKNQIQ